MILIIRFINYSFNSDNNYRYANLNCSYGFIPDKTWKNQNYPKF